MGGWAGRRGGGAGRKKEGDHHPKFYLVHETPLSPRCVKNSISLSLSLFFFIQVTGPDER